MRVCLELADVGLALGRIRTDRSDCLKIAGIDSVGEINRRPSRRYGLLPLRAERGIARHLPSDRNARSLIRCSCPITA